MVKNWTDKLNNKEVPQVKPSPRALSDVVEGDLIRVPTVRQVEEFMRGVPFGKSMDVRTLRHNEEGLPD